MKGKFCFTVDVEPLPRLEDSSKAMDVSISGLKKILSLLKKIGIKGTFFVNGKFLENADENLVRKIEEMEHEIGAHGFKHISMDPRRKNKIRKEVRLIKESLSELGIKTTGFRAPNCSYSETLLKILANEGYKYDSSLHPTFVPRKYNNIGLPKSPFPFNGEILEIPITVSPFFRIPLSWIWFRNFNLQFIKFLTKIMLKKYEHIVFYLHSWEFGDLPETLPSYYTRNCDTIDRRIINYINFVKESAKFYRIKDLINSNR